MTTFFMVFHKSGYPGSEVESIFQGSTYQSAHDAVPAEFQVNLVPQENWPVPQEPFTAAIVTNMEREMVEFYSDGSTWYSVVTFDAM
jgi:hypothetical protein